VVIEDGCVQANRPAGVGRRRPEVIEADMPRETALLIAVLMPLLSVGVFAVLLARILRRPTP
jgi:hypothetical protein